MKASDRIAAADSATCLNCGTALLGPHCHECGQKRRVHRTVTSLGGDLVQSLFNFEGRFFRTVPMLIWRPGELTRRYVAGERAKFVSPLTTFLFSVFLLAAVLGQLPSGAFFDNLVHGLTNLRDSADTARAKTEKQLAERRAERARLVAAGQSTQAVDRQIDSLEEDNRAMVAVSQDQPSRIITGTADVQSGLAGLDERWRKAKANPDLLIYKIKETAYAYSWLLVPMSLPFLWLLFPFSRRFRMYDHAIFTIYSLSFMSLLAIALGIVSLFPVQSGVVALVGVLVPPVHLFRHLRGAYGLGRLSALWRTSLLLVFATFVLVCWVLVLMLIGAA